VPRLRHLAYLVWPSGGGVKMKTLWHLIQILFLALAFLGVLLLIDLVAGSLVGEIVAVGLVSVGLVFAVKWAFK